MVVHGRALAWPKGLVILAREWHQVCNPFATGIAPLKILMFTNVPTSDPVFLHQYSVL